MLTHWSQFVPNNNVNGHLRTLSSKSLSSGRKTPSYLLTYLLTYPLALRAFHTDTGSFYTSESSIFFFIFPGEKEGKKVVSTDEKQIYFLLEAGWYFP